MAWSPWFLGRDTSQWVSPVDHFKPQRWDEDDAHWFATPSGEPRHEFAWLPFGAGPRGCLGRRLGVMEATLCTAYLLQLFDFEFQVRIDWLEPERPFGNIPLALIACELGTTFQQRINSPNYEWEAPGGLACGSFELSRSSLNRPTSSTRSKASRTDNLILTRVSLAAKCARQKIGKELTFTYDLTLNLKGSCVAAVTPRQ